MLLPHELLPWISRDGTVAPGFHHLTEPLHVPRGYVLRGQRGQERATRLVFADANRNGIELDGGLAGLDVSGGRLSVNVRDGATQPFVSDVRITDSALIPLWVGRCVGARVSRVLVMDSPDNGIQIESPMDCELHSCAVVGTFGNKAIDMSHGRPERVRLVHVTVVAQRGYGVGCIAWALGSENAMLNCAIFAPPPGPGASGYAIHLPNGSASGSFAGTIVQGDVAGVTRELPGVTLGANLASDLPLWASIALPTTERLRPGANRRMWGASLRTALSADLDGARRIPWRGHLASGALARSAGRG